MTATPEGEALSLSPEERELVSQELAALLPALRDDRQEGYRSLAKAVDEGTVPPDLVPLLEGLVAMALETGRARRLYTAEGERVLTEVFRRTPGGRELVRHLEEVNKALGVLSGRTLWGVRVAMRTLGHFTVALDTEGASVTLAVRPGVVTLESVAIGGGGGPG
ncbi:MAG TPA: hypothetical protein VNL95_00260 [Dehalococcoidia bacterium]|nr:hypothetical protein [Dehalococcoidia bacterium]